MEAKCHIAVGRYVVRSSAFRIVVFRSVWGIIELFSDERLLSGMRKGKCFIFIFKFYFNLLSAVSVDATSEITNVSLLNLRSRYNSEPDLEGVRVVFGSRVRMWRGGWQEMVDCCGR